MNKKYAPSQSTRVELLAVASGGGHWAQLQRIRPAWEGRRVAYVSVSADLRVDIGDAPFLVVPDGNRNTKMALVRMMLRMLVIVFRLRPRVVVSTGAAPGFWAVFWGKMFGAKTIWLDSIANGRELSLSGAKAGKFADLWLTQWPEVSRPDGPIYKGSIL